MSDYRLGRLNGRFVVVWYDNGKRKRWTLQATTPAEARAELRTFARDRDQIRQRKITVKEIWDDYAADRKAEGKTSVGRMADAWKRLAPAFGALTPDCIHPSLVRSYLHHRREQGISDGTIHVELGYLRAALRRGGYQVNITLPPKPRPRGRYLSGEEARRLIDAAAMPHLRLYMLLALYTAGRPAAILDLEWDRVDFAARKITLDNPSRDRTAKGRATVPMAEALVGPLQDAKKAALTGWVIEWAGQRIASIKKGIQRAAERAGLKEVTPYVLRHSAARFMVEGGVPMSEVSQFLGHTSTSVTERVYGRYSPDYLRKAGDAISTALQGLEKPVTVNKGETKRG